MVTLNLRGYIIPNANIQYYKTHWRTIFYRKELIYYEFMRVHFNVAEISMNREWEW